MRWGNTGSDNRLEFLGLITDINQSRFKKDQHICNRILTHIVVKLENIKTNKTKLKTAREKEQLPSEDC